MKMTNPRFIKSIIETAGKSTGDMPWTRGARRAAFIAQRSRSDAGKQKTA